MGSDNFLWFRTWRLRNLASAISDSEVGHVKFRANYADFAVTRSLLSCVCFVPFVGLSFPTHCPRKTPGPIFEGDEHE